MSKIEIDKQVIETKILAIIDKQEKKSFISFKNIIVNIKINGMVIDYLTNINGKLRVCFKGKYQLIDGWILFGTIEFNKVLDYLIKNKY